MRDLDAADLDALNARSAHPLIQEFRPEQLRSSSRQAEGGPQSEEAEAAGGNI